MVLDSRCFNLSESVPGNLGSQVIIRLHMNLNPIENEAGKMFLKTAENTDTRTRNTHTHTHMHTHTHIHVKSEKMCVTPDAPGSASRPCLLKCLFSGRDPGERSSHMRSQLNCC